jgi:pyruvate decarboxylase
MSVRFVICNNGYTIERLIHGWKAEYNDIQPWEHCDLLHAFGADPKSSKTYQVKTKHELDELFKNEEFSSAPYIQVMIQFS